MFALVALLIASIGLIVGAVFSGAVFMMVLWALWEAAARAFLNGE